MVVFVHGPVFDLTAETKFLSLGLLFFLSHSSRFVGPLLRAISYPWNLMFVG